MSAKTIPFKSPAQLPATAEAWVQTREKAEPVAATGPVKRLTVNIPEPLHRRLKLDCVQRGIMISDMIRDLLSEKYPEPDGPR